jgi:hypothetical protein
LDGQAGFKVGIVSAIVIVRSTIGEKATLARKIKEKLVCVDVQQQPNTYAVFDYHK